MLIKIFDKIINPDHITHIEEMATGMSRARFSSGEFLIINRSPDAVFREILSQEMPLEAHPAFIAGLEQIARRTDVITDQGIIRGDAC